MSGLARRPTQVLDAYLRLSKAFQNKPIIATILIAALRELETIETACLDTYEGHLLDDAANAQLGVLGAIVGEPRLGRTDTVYRAAIRGRILANRSVGRVNTLLRIAQTVVPTATGYGKTEGVLSILVEIDGLTASEPGVLTQCASLLQIAAAGTVSTQLAVYPDAADAFTFGAAAVELSDSGMGYGTDTGGLLGFVVG